MRFGSVCSGIEGASVAWHPLGWRAAWFAEIDAGASAVLRWRFPDVPNHGDMTRLAAMVLRREIEAPDVLVGGTPCQSFSVAGMRCGLADPRGQLTLTFIQLADAIDTVRRADAKPPAIIVWENVPGVLNHKDNPFGCFLAGLAGEDEPLVPAGKKWTNAGLVCGPERAIAWRILDAQFFRLAQRRRRVFVVASARAGFDPAAILLEFDGLRRDSPPSRETGEDVTHAVAPCLTGSGQGIERTGDPRGQGPVVAVIDDGGRVRGAAGVVATLDASYGRLQGCSGQDSNHGYSHLVVGAFGGGATGGPRDLAACHEARGQKNDFEVETFIVHGTQDPCVSEHTAFALGRNSGGENVIAFSSKDHGADASVGDTPTLRAGGHADSHANAGVPPAVAYAVSENQRAELRLTDYVRSISTTGGKPGQGYPAALVERRFNPPPEAVCVTGSVTHTLKAEGFDASEDGTGRGQPIVPTFAFQMAVRRLVPVECERLQGLPDGWTLVPVKRASKARAKKLRAAGPDGSWAEIDGEPWMLAADGPRYKQIGNSMAVSVMRWIGRRIDRAAATVVEGRCVPVACPEAGRTDELAALLAAPACPEPGRRDEFSGMLAA